MVKKAEIVSLRPERQKETHFLKLPFSVDDFGWHVELDQKVCEQSAGCNGDESWQIDWPLLDRRDRRAATLRLKSWTPTEHR